VAFTVYVCLLGRKFYLQTTKIINISKKCEIELTFVKKGIIDLTKIRNRMTEIFIIRVAEFETQREFVISKNEIKNEKFR